MPETKTLEVRYRGRIIEHLTVQTYQSPVAAIAEIVANAWDADSATVKVALPAQLDATASLTVVDDGNGMTLEQCQDRYLEVGYPRRGDDARSKSERKQRPLMGRKGIGKFAGFGIANVMVVDTVSRETGERTVFRLEYERLRGESEKYIDEDPTDVPGVQWYAKGEHNQAPGTKIELQELKLRQRPSPAILRRSLARRFLLLERAADFSVSVDGIAVADEGDDSGVQFNYPQDWDASERVGIAVDADGWGTETVDGHEIRWRAVFYNDTIKDEELRGISVFAHAKLAQRPFFFELGERGGTQAQAGMQYLSGQVDASFLDDADHDLISIERQRVDWEDPLASPLLEWGQTLLRKLLGSWQKRRVEAKVRLLNDKVSRFSYRLERLPSRERKIVAGAITKFAGVRALNDEQFTVLSEGVLTAWEGGRLKELIHDVAETDSMSEKDLLAILMEHQVLTALHTAEAVKAKKQVVSGLRDRIRRRELENAVRDFIALNPWLIDPKWDTFRVEKALKTTIDAEAKKRMSPEMLDKRIDLVLASGEQLLVLEFMRPGLTLDADHLSRFDYYVNALRVDVRTNTAGQYKTVIGYIVADKIDKDLALVEKLEEMAKNNKFAMEWESLLDGASRHWAEFFDAIVERSPDDPRINDLKEASDSHNGEAVADPDQAA